MTNGILRSFQETFVGAMRKVGFHPVESDGDVAHCLAIASPNCPECGAPPFEHEVKDYDPAWQDGKVYCKCGAFVRHYDAGI
jgi:hypothetical protein